MGPEPVLLRADYDVDFDRHAQALSQNFCQQLRHTTDGVRPDTKMLLYMARREAQGTGPVFLNIELVILSKPSAFSTSSWEMTAESSAEEIGFINKLQAVSTSTVAGTPRTDGSGGIQDTSHGS